MADHIYTYENPTSEKDLGRALRVLENDGIIAYPTDVNWAIGCDCVRAKALDRIHALKPSHPRDRPFSLICSSISMAAEYAAIDGSAYRLLKKAWPGPYTILLTANKNFPRQLKDKRRVVGLRIPACPLVLALVAKLGRPLATTSIPPIKEGDFEVNPHFGYQVFEAFGHALDLVLDLGDERPGLESTIVDLTSGAPEIVRRGIGDPSLFELQA